MKHLLTTAIYHLFPASILDLAWRMAVTMLSVVIAYVTDLNVSHHYVVAAIMVVYSADWFLGTWLAVRRGRRFKMSKFVEKPGQMLGCWILFMMFASIEKSFVTAGWIVEGFMFPILFFQLFDALENANELGILKGRAFQYVAQKYKEYFKTGELTGDQVRNDD